MSALIKQLLKRSLRSVGIEVLRTRNANLEPEVLKNVLRASGAEVILDVGANVGQYGELVFNTGFQGTLVSFEALPDAHKILCERAKRHGGGWVVAPCGAVGSKRGEIEVNVSGNSVSSSVLPMQSAHLDAAPQSRFVGHRTVNMDLLDDLATPLISTAGDLMIKVDTQGYELEVLKGASGLLSRTTALQLELSLVPLYTGAPTLVEMISYVQARGFELFGIVPGFWDTRSGRSLQVDGFFVRGG